MFIVSFCPVARLLAYWGRLLLVRQTKRDTSRPKGKEEEEEEEEGRLSSWRRDPSLCNKPAGTTTTDRQTDKSISLTDQENHRKEEREKEEK